MDLKNIFDEKLKNLGEGTKSERYLFEREMLKRAKEDVKEAILKFKSFLDFKRIGGDSYSQEDLQNFYEEIFGKWEESLN